MYTKVNHVAMSGTITKNSVFKADSGKFAKARIAHGVRKDATIFKDIILFPDKDSGRIEGLELLADGAKVVVEGRLTLEQNPRQGFEPREQIVVESIRPNTEEEEDLPSGGETAPQAPVTDIPDYDNLPADIES